MKGFICCFPTESNHMAHIAWWCLSHNWLCEEIPFDNANIPNKDPHISCPIVVCVVSLWLFWFVDVLVCGLPGFWQFHFAVLSAVAFSKDDRYDCYLLWELLSTLDISINAFWISINFHLISIFQVKWRTQSASNFIFPCASVGP